MKKDILTVLNKFYKENHNSTDQEKRDLALAINEVLIVYLKMPIYIQLIKGLYKQTDPVAFAFEIEAIRSFLKEDGFLDLEEKKE